jgi:fused signal recognition particle receptor
MFDGLKGTIDSFRSDAETAVDEAEADADAEETIEDPNTDGDRGDVESPSDTDAGASPGTGEPDASPESEDTADDGTSIGQRARSLVRGELVIEEDDLDDPLREFELALVSADVAMPAAEAITDGVREELVGETRSVTTGAGTVVEDAIRDTLLHVLDTGEPGFDERIDALDRPATVVFTGVNGVGKTTTIAKIARRLDDRGLSAVLANGDTYRAGANEQLVEHAEALGVPSIAHEQGGDPAAVLYDAVEYAEANDVDVVLGDTAGRLHTSDDLMQQLDKIDRVVDPDLTVFVDEAVAGQDAVERAREFDDAAAIDGTVLTKADADAGGGAAVSVVHATGRPVYFLGTGQGYDDLRPFDPETFVDELLDGA